MKNKIFVLVSLVMVTLLSADFDINANKEKIIPPILIEEYEPIKISENGEIEGGKTQIKILALAKLSISK